MVYLKYLENVIPFSKLIGLLFLFCLPLLSILFLITKRNDLALPVMGTIFLVYTPPNNTAHQLKEGKGSSAIKVRKQVTEKPFTSK